MVTSSLLNPSKKIAELLSNFLEFDPNQLQIGIWSGDFSLNEVGLRCDAINPLLNKNNSAGERQLHLKLVSGNVGTLRLRIPWKRLVWGQGDVRVDVSDVHVVLAYESRQETAARMAAKGETIPEEDVVATRVEEIPRETKQEWLRNAERLNLQGQPIPSSFALPKTQGASEHAEKEEQQPVESRMEAWIKQTTNNFAWRFFAGLQASIRNIRIVLIQDGFEIGVINHSIDVRPKIVNLPDTVKEAKDLSNPSAGSSSTPPFSDTTMPVKYLGDCDEGEQVEKTIHINGLGFFIRQHERLLRATNVSMKFSSSVAPDDYLLRPADLRVDFSFFYPYPPENVKKNFNEDTKEPTKSSGMSVESTASSKLRRGKREKRAMKSSQTSVTTESSGGVNDRPIKKGRTSILRDNDDDNLDNDGHQSFMVSSDSRILSRSSMRSSSLNEKHRIDEEAFVAVPNVSGVTDSDAEMSDFITPLPPRSLPETGDIFSVPRRQSSISRVRNSPQEILHAARQHRRSSRYQRPASFEENSENHQRVLSDYSSVSSAFNYEHDQQMNRTPHVNLHVLFGDIKTVCSTKHFDLAQLFVANFIRLRNGRPDRTIQSCLVDIGPEFTRKVFIDIDPTHPVIAQLPNGEQVEMPSSGNRLQLTLQLPQRQSKKKDIVRLWWKYAYDNVIVEVRQRRKERDAFVDKDTPFDWESQRYRRKEYIDLYIANRLEKSAYLHSVEVKALTSAKKADELLLSIEDELPIEQLLLYRAIARALRVRGMNKMPKSVKDVRLGEAHPERIARKTSRQRIRRGSLLRKGASASNFDVSRSSLEIGTSTEVTSSLDTLRNMCDAVRSGAGPGTPSVDASTKLGQKRDFPPKKEDKSFALRDRRSNLQFTNTPITPASLEEDSSQKAVNTDRVSEDDIFLESRTVRSFKTAKSSSTPFKQAESMNNLTGTDKKNLKLYLTVNVVSYELLLCEDEMYRSVGAQNPLSGDSNLSVSDRRAASQIDTHLINLFTDDQASDDDISELTFLSTVSGLDNNVEVGVSVEEQEADGNEPILSSNDFLLFSMPNKVILLVKVSSVTASFRGNTGGDRQSSLSVGNILVSGIKNGTLLSVGSAEHTLDESASNPMKEIRFDKRRKSANPGTRSSMNQSGVLNLHNRALHMSLTKWENEKVMELDIAKVNVTVELEAVMKLKGFISSSSVIQPRSVMPKSAYDDVRRFMRLHAKSMEKAAKLLQTDLSIACRIHGVELNVPCSELAEDCSTSFSPRPDIIPSIDERSKVMITTTLVEYYDGTRIFDVSPSLIPLFDEKSIYSDAKSIPRSSLFGGVPFFIEERRSIDRKLCLLDVERILNLHRSPSSHHAVVTLSGINFCVRSPLEKYSDNQRVTSLLRNPFDIELLLTTHLTPERIPGHPRHQLSLAGSNLQFIFSDSRLEVISQLLNLWSTNRPKLKAANTQTTNDDVAINFTPRLDVLAHQVQLSLDLSVICLELSFVADSNQRHQNPSYSEKEIILEECISDFLSIIACFDLNYPVKDAVSIAENFCVDRLIALGMTESNAFSCIDTARFKFLGDIQVMKNTQSHVLQELSESVGFRDGEVNGCTENLVETLQEEIMSSDFNCDDESRETGSEESIELIETALRNAVERTLLSFLKVLNYDENEWEDHSDMVVLKFPDGLFLSITKLFYDSYLELNVPTATFKNSSGINFLKLGFSSLISESETKEDLMEGNSAAVADHSESRHGLSLSIFGVDDGFIFGGGGLPLSVLGSENAELKRSTRQTFINILGGNIDIFFAQKVASEIIDTMTNAFSALNRHLPSSNASPPYCNATTKEESTSESVTSMNFTSLSLILVSDELQPFCGFLVSDCEVKTALSGIAGDDNREQRISLESPMVKLLSLGPECQYFPEVIAPLQSSRLPEQVNEKMIFRLYFSPSSNPGNHGSFLNIEVENVRVTLLRQFINEIIQFVSSEFHGVGLLLSKYKSKAQTDRDGNPPRPFLYEIALKNASVLLPRSSVCVDMVAIEVEKLVVANSFHRKSFEMPSASSPLRKNATEVSGNFPEQYNSHGISGSVDAEFFDCEDIQLELPIIDAPIPSLKTDIPRISITIKKARLFTSLNKTKSELITSNGTLLRHFYRINGRASNYERVYTRRSFSSNLDTSLLNDIIDRCWEEISINPVDIEILIDYAPHLRVLISDRLDDSQSGSSVSLDLRMSQFYLLLSIWYANMQEMPVMFPFSVAEIEGNAKALEPPLNFPEYGSIEFLDLLKDLSQVRSEIACSFEEIVFLCSFDKHGYFESDPRCLEMLSSLKQNGISGDKGIVMNVKLGFPTVHVTSDSSGIMRIGIGASALRLVDERRDGHFKTVLDISSFSQSNKTQFLDSHDSFPINAASWADLLWGLDCDGTTLSSELPLSVQVSVFMTPGWVLTNFGIESAFATIFDFTPIWITLDFFSLYFSKSGYGNPVFEAATRKEQLKALLQKKQRALKQIGQPGLNIDFRLWLTRPYLCIPSSTKTINAPSLRIDGATGLWYHFKSLGTYSSQEVCSTNLSLAIAQEFEIPGKCRVGHSAYSTTKTLIDGLSFGFRMDSNTSNGHTDYCLKMPFLTGPMQEASSVCRISSSEIEADSVVLNPPTVCTPVEEQTRSLGPSICELTLIIDALPVASDLLITLLTGSVDINETKLFQGAADSTVNSDTKTISASSFSANACICGLRLFVIDPVLGKHLPIAVCCISSVKLAASQMSGNEKADRSALRSEAPPGDLQLAVDLNFWADYFKLGITRSWEPLLEPFSCLLLLEKSIRRGQGMSLNSECQFHINVTGALLLIMDEAITSFSRALVDSFGSKNAPSSVIETSFSDHANEESIVSQYAGTFIDQHLDSSSCGTRNVRHHVPKPLRSDDRVAFSMLNLTGQRIRVHQQSKESDSAVPERTAVVTYLEHSESTRLEFEATVSVIHNLHIVDVPFPGLPHSLRDSRGQGANDPSINIQLPGFKWIQGMSVDTSGRKFGELEPRSSAVLQKLNTDWRLKNAVKLLSEVGIENGGRLITVRSLFEIRNRTAHTICLSLHPDPTHIPISGHKQGFAKVPSGNTQPDVFEAIRPGAYYQVPTLLLESALRLKGSHLGSFWIHPADGDINDDLFELVRARLETNVTDIAIGYCSRPVQLAKVVHETSQIFQSVGGDDVAPDKGQSGIQVSCPISDGSDGVPLAPFCYTVEIKRSPIVKSFENEPDEQDRPRVHFQRPRMHPMKDGSSPEYSDAGTGKKTRRNDTRDSSRFEHGPVSYSLSIHPPLVIENLLPTRGRFELMHATRRTVLWFSDLLPGERVPIHTVGLDAPLLLLVNLGFCRTPIGEGALVHHGNDAGSIGPQSGLKSLGKAVSKGTKQIGKTLTAISDSPVKRGKVVVLGLQNPAVHKKKTGKLFNKKNVSFASMGGSTLGLDTGNLGENGGKVHSVESISYSMDDIATETAVVDSIGQRLTLGIDNSRGGGGQRRISLFCPFWILNTTEHALRYKQDKTSSYVSGTVISPSMDGSKSVDSSNRIASSSPTFFSSNRHFGPKKKAAVGKVMPTDETTIFAGKPGALATLTGRQKMSAMRLAPLLEKEIPLDKLSLLAFMFSFYEDVLAIGHSKMAVQLADGTQYSDYTSDWSKGFSLDSIGVPQVIGMHCKDGRVLEVSVTISIAPGLLSAYTKIVRFAPRFVLVNQMERPLRLWQDSSVLHSVYDSELTESSTNQNWHFRVVDEDDSDESSPYKALFGRSSILDDCDGMLAETTAHHSALYITTASGRSLVPFHLPDTRGDRQLRIDLGGNCNLTASFNADVTGEHTLKVNKAVDLRLIQHVNTRASPHYKVVLPPPDCDLDWDGELGVWFETDWGRDTKVIVKGTKRGRYSFNHTDIHVGDELLRIDNVEVSHMTFLETMKILKERVAFVSFARQVAVRDSNRRERAMSFRQKRMLHRVATPEEFAVTGEEQLVLTFRTFEERLRRLRANASRTRNHSTTTDRSSHAIRHLSSLPLPSGADTHGQPLRRKQEHDSVIGELKVEMRNIHSSLFVIISEQDPDTLPYRIENRAMNHNIFFRQHGCTGHPWNILKPGETKIYTWEEPTKPRRLCVKVGLNNISFLEDEGTNDSGNGEFQEDSDSETDINGGRPARFKQILSAQYVDSEDRAGFGAVRIVKLEEIGFNDMLPCPGVHEATRSSSILDPSCFLNCQVDTDGATRVLVISDNKGIDERRILQRHLATIERQIRGEANRQADLLSLKKLMETNRFSGEEEKHEESQEVELISQSLNPKEMQSPASSPGMVGHLHDIYPNLSTIENKAKTLAADFPETSTITGINQVIVEVLEATGLKPYDVTGFCNPYCEIVVKGRSKTKRSFLSRSNVRKRTYYVEKTLAPKWSDQVFIFDVPHDAVSVTRGHLVQIRLRDFKFVGSHSYLGQTNVHLRSIRNQQELVGWYPLVGRTGRRELEDSQANWGRGSVKLRVQWIYTIPALLDYFLLLSERRLLDLRHSVAGMTTQLEHLLDSETGSKSKVVPFTTGRIPNLLAMKAPKQLLHQGTNRAAIPDAPDSMDGGINRTTLNPSAINGPLRQSRGRLKWLLYSQTAESKRNRKFGNNGENKEEIARFEAKQMAQNLILSIAEIRSLDPLRGTGEVANADDTCLPTVGPSLDQLNSASMEELDDRSLERCSGITLDANLRQRRRAYSLEDTQFNQLINQEVLDFALRTRSCTFDGPFESHDEMTQNRGVLLAAISEADAERANTVNSLFQEGILYHRSNDYFHNRHLFYEFRAALFETHRTTETFFQPKSLLRVAPSIKFFRSWTAAKTILDDSGFLTEATDSEFHVSLVQNLDPDIDIQDDASFNGSQFPQVNCRSFLVGKLRLPHFAPEAMGRRAVSRAEDIYVARNNFERACKRSLRAVLNPGGWLTIRPITALNLTDSFTGMHIKLRYGSEVVNSQTVDARASPSWTSEEYSTDDDNDPPDSLLFSRTATSKRGRPLEFQFSTNDLQAYVEPQKTSGSLRLSVVGERLNLRTEIGVLNIPLGSAISCCVECIENALEAQPDAITSMPMYVRWFPLMSPKDSVSVDGDMGNSIKPKETEQLRDSFFHNYFTPCIKLAFIWQPNQQESLRTEFQSVRTGVGSLTINEDDDWYRQLKSPLTDRYFNSDVTRLSMALIDSQRALDLLSLSLSDIDIRYSETKAKTRVGLVIGWIQVDQQDAKAREPVVLAPTPVEHPQPTFQFLAVKDNLRSKGNIASYEYIGVSLQELDLTVEEAWMFGVWDFFISVVRRREGKRKVVGRTSVNEKKSRENATLLSTTQFRPVISSQLTSEGLPMSSLYSLLFSTNASGEPHQDHKVYVEQLLLGFVKVNLSYLKGTRGNWELTDGGEFIAKNIDGLTQGLPEKMAMTAGGLRVVTGKIYESRSDVMEKWASYTYDEDLWTDSGAAKSTYNLPNIIAGLVPSISDAPIRLQGKAIDHIFESSTEIFDSIKNYYVNETLKQIYKIVGSLDFVGNPTMVLNSFATGVRDFFITPSQAFLRTPKNPSKVGIGIAKGTLSLFSHSASGVFGFTAKMAATAGQAAATLSFDTEYVRWHREMILVEAKSLDRQYRKRGLQSVQGMLTRPVWDIIRGTALGVSGLIISPYRGAQKNGSRGLLNGVALGVVGVIAKPTVGVLDAFTHFVGSIHDLAKSVNVLEKRHQPARKLRLPSYFSLEDVLEPFDMTTARSVTLLRLYPLKAKLASRSQSRKNVLMTETHVASEVLNMEPGVEIYIIVSTLRVILCKVKKESVGTLVPFLCWEVYLSTDSIVTPKVHEHGHNGVALTITTREASKEGFILSPPPTTMHSDDKPELAIATTSHNADLLDCSTHPLEKEEPSPALDIPSRHKFQELKPMISARNLFNGSTNEMSHMGTRPSQDALWTEGSEHSNNVQEGELQLENHFHGFRQSQQGDILEWYTVLAEFQHRRQLSRIHNAICCITGTLDAIILDRGLGTEGSTEGYTSFGDLIFTPENFDVGKMDSIDDEVNCLKQLEKVPWVHESTFKEYRFVGSDKTTSNFVQLRHMWTLKREFEASQSRGGPLWLIKARSDAMFIPEEPPSLPKTPVAKSAAVKTVLDRLEKGAICYNEATEIIAALNHSYLSNILEASHEICESDLTNLYSSTRIESSDSMVDSGHSPLRQLSHSETFWSTPSHISSYVENWGNSLNSKVDSRGLLLDMDALSQSSDTESVGPAPNDAKQSIGNLSQSLSLGTVASLSMSQHIGDKISSQSMDERSFVERSMEEQTDEQVPDRVDKIEGMLEQLVEITLLQAKIGLGFASAQPPPVASENSDVAMLRQEIEQLRLEVKAKKEISINVETMQAELQELRSALNGGGVASLAALKANVTAEDHTAPPHTFRRNKLERPFRKGAEKVTILGKAIMKGEIDTSKRIRHSNPRGRVTNDGLAARSEISSLSDDVSLSHSVSSMPITSFNMHPCIAPLSSTSAAGRIERIEELNDQSSEGSLDIHSVGEHVSKKGEEFYESSADESGGVLSIVGANRTETL